MKECGLIQEFLNYLKFAKHFSEHTGICYKGDLEQFCNFLVSRRGADSTPVITPSQQAGGTAVAMQAETKIEQLLLAVDVDAVKAFLVHLNENQYGKATIRRKLAVLRSFYKFLVKRRWIDSNPVMTVRAPRQEKKLPKFLEYEQVQQLLNKPPLDNWMGVRDSAMLEALYGTGMRVSELVALNIDDIDFTGKVIHIKGRGKKQRTAPLGPSTLQSIKHYIEVRNKHATNNGSFDNEILFVNRYGKRLGTRSVRRKMDKYLAMAGLDPSSSPHTLRHSFTIHRLNSGADLHSVQELLGHQSLSTTRNYLQLVRAKLKEV
jgi:integrase/recombinase XerC